jgi:hypothetical protein
MSRFFDRTGWQPVESTMPFHDMLEAEDDGEDGKPGEYELMQRMIGAKAFFRFLKARGIHPAAMLKQLVAAGRACHEEPFHTMTMGEAGQLLGEGKAAHSWRCKILSREIELSGQKGSKLPGQKGKEASESYRKVRRKKSQEATNGAANGSANGSANGGPVRSGGKSFLRLLKVTSNQKSQNEN